MRSVPCHLQHTARRLPTACLFFFWFCLFASAQTPGRFDHIKRVHGLSQSGVHCVLRDSAGYMWFGTGNGLDRYDGHEIRTFQAGTQDATALPDPTVTALFEGPDGLIWIGTGQGHVLAYDPAADRMVRPIWDGAGMNLLKDLPVHALCAGPEGGLVVGSEAGALLLDTVTGNGRAAAPKATGPVRDVLLVDGTVYLAGRRGLFRLTADAPEPALVFDGCGAVRALACDADGRMWLAGEHGLYYRDINGDWVEEPLVRNRVHSGLLSLDAGFGGVVWVGTEEGLVRLSAPMADGQAELVVYHHDPAEPQSLSYDQVFDVYEDPGGVLWVATWGGGVNRMDLLRERFFHYRKLFGDPTSLGNNMVVSLEADRTGRLWVGTEDGLSLYLPGNPGSFRNISLEAPGGSKNQDVVAALAQGKRDDMWVGTYAGLLHMDHEGNVLARWEGDAFPGDRIWTLASDGDHTLWIGTRHTGLLRMRLGKPGLFERLAGPVPMSGTPGLDRISTLLYSRAGRLWVGTTGQGLCLVDPGDPPAFTLYQAREDDPQSLPENVVISLHEDNHERFWVGTRGGGFSLMTAENRFRTWHTGHGLPDNTVYAMLHDDTGRLWLSTDNGLAVFDPETEQFEVYKASDGLQDNEFNAFCRYRDRDGRLYFGGINGFNAFYSQDLAIKRVRPRAVITHLQVDGHPPGALGADLQTVALPAPGEVLTLDDRTRGFSLGFAVLSYVDPSRRRYAYKLDGLHHDWVYRDGGVRGATFSGLASGDYTFRLKGADVHGGWSHEAVLPIKVLPPFWRSGWFALFYIPAGLGLLGLVLVYQRRKLLSEREVVERLREVDRIKDDFLANTSHELRTPLNGIIGLAESMLDGAAGTVNVRQAAQLTMIASSGRRLSALVNDILDFSKLKHRDLALQLSDVDINALTHVVFTLCEPPAADKGLALINDVPAGQVLVRADEGRIKQVLYNLVDNAVKFTEQGEVRVSCRRRDAVWVVSVQDTGIGIPLEKQGRIFKSFEQVEDSSSRAQGGAGLGLALTRRLIALHGGSISVESRPGEGACFSFSLPRVETSEGDGVATSTPMFRDEEARSGYFGSPASPAVTVPAYPVDTRFHILVVDDEPVNRQVLLNHLSRLQQQVSAARSGPEALAFLEEHHVDMVLLDIMMPGMSGFEVCRKMRRAHPVEAMPILFISARREVEDVVAAFEAGGSDYLAKPFPRQELLQRVKVHLRLLDARRRLMETHAELAGALDLVQLKNKELISAHHKLVIQEKMATIGTLASGVVHELKNPANYTYICAQSLREDLSGFRDYLLALAGDADPEVSAAITARMEPLFEMLDTVYNGTSRLKEIAHNLSGFTRMGRGEERFASLADCLRSTLALVEARYRDMVRFHPKLDAGLDTLCRPAELGQVFMNLMVNACQAVMTRGMQKTPREKGDVWVTTELDGRSGRIVIRDNGIGIPPELADEIFEPFFTTKPEGEGTGLGLSISKQIVDDHGGTVTCVSRPGEGSVFTVVLPLRQENHETGLN